MLTVRDYLVATWRVAAMTDAERAALAAMIEAMNVGQPVDEADYDLTLPELVARAA